MRGTSSSAASYLIQISHQSSVTHVPGLVSPMFPVAQHVALLPTQQAPAYSSSKALTPPSPHCLARSRPSSPSPEHDHFPDPARAATSRPGSPRPLLGRRCLAGQLLPPLSPATPPEAPPRRVMRASGPSCPSGAAIARAPPPKLALAAPSTPCPTPRGNPSNSHHDQGLPVPWPNASTRYEARAKDSQSRHNPTRHTFPKYPSNRDP